MKVLFISPEPDSEPVWVAPAQEPIELIREASLAGAAVRLRSERVDAVVVDHSVSDASDGDLERLKAESSGAPVLVLGSPDPMGLASADERVRLAAELSRTRRELDRSERRFRDVIERNVDAIVVVDPQGVVRFVNRMATGLFEAAPEDLLGTPFGFPMTVGESTELDLLQKNGPPRVVEMRVVESEWEGQMACIASLRDITERKRAEQDARRLIQEQTARSAAEESARRFRFLADASALLSTSLEYENTLAALVRLCVAEAADWALVYVVAEDGDIQLLEVAHRDPAKSAQVRELRDSPISREGSHPVLRVLETGEPVLVPYVDEARLADIAQSARHLELIRELGAGSFMLVPLIARDRSIGALGLVSADAGRPFGQADLALAEELASRAALAVDNARLYRDAQEAIRTKSDLLAVISHDLRTPLNSIIGYAELMTMGIPEPIGDEARERVERIRASAEHLLHLINQLLALTRLDAGREEVRIEEVDLATMVREVAMVIEPLALARHLRFHLDLPEAPRSFRTDPAKLRQVLINLAANAVKFTESGEIRLVLREGGADTAVIRIEDTGVGIAEEHVERIFEPFWQVDPAGRGADGGTGLGLSVVGRLVELLGGTITVESVVGAGSAFTVALPAMVHAPAGEPD